MEEVLLTGVAALDDDSKLVFTQHCVNTEHWARNKKRKATAIMGDSSTAAGSFTVLVPGVNGAVAEDFLDGKVSRTNFW